MNGKQRARAAIQFQTPEQLPMDFGRMGFSDFHWVGWNQIGTGDHSKRRTLDEWGCTWGRTEVKNMGVVVGHPLHDWAALDHYRWPDPDDPKFYEGIEKRFEGSDGKYVHCGFFMLLFERMHSLRGFQNTMEDLLLERERAEALADRIVEFDLRVIENIVTRFPGLIDGLNFTDDWGTELDVFISPKLWIDFFAPRYKRIFDFCHQNGWLVTMHSCGKVNNIIGPLIDIGVNALNLQQPRALGIEKIGKQFAGKVCFLSLCDIQHTLPFKGKEEIEEEARLLMECWATDEGGFILSDYGDDQSIGASPEKARWMFDAFMAADRWKGKARA